MYEGHTSQKGYHCALSRETAQAQLAVLDAAGNGTVPIIAWFNGYDNKTDLCGAYKDQLEWMRANRLVPTRCLQRRPAAPRALEERQQTRQQTPLAPAASSREGGGLCAMVVLPGWASPIRTFCPGSSITECKATYISEAGVATVRATACAGTSRWAALAHRCCV